LLRAPGPLIKRYGVKPERIGDVILAASNAGLCLGSDGDDCVVAGFSDDIARNGGGFAR
jgi:hypothetical protein